MTRFQALELSIQTIRSLRQPLAKLRQQDPKLGEQLQRAASSVALNLSEGRRRTGKDRRHHFRIAAGSADETLTALRVAEAWGCLRPSDIDEPLRLLDRLLAILWRLGR